jgi:hypothetical protein
MKTKKFLTILGCLLIILIASTSCCTFCKIETSTSTFVDTTYVTDTIPFHIEGDVAIDSEDIYIVYGEDTTAMTGAEYFSGEWELNDLEYDVLVPPDDFIIDYGDVNTKKKLSFFSDTAEADTEFAHAKSYIADDKIKLELYQKDSVIQIIRDSSRVLINAKEVVIKEKSRVLEKAEKRVKVLAYIVIGLVVLLIISLVALKLVFALYKR